MTTLSRQYILRLMAQDRRLEAAASQKIDWPYDSRYDSGPDWRQRLTAQEQTELLTEGRKCVHSN